LIWSLVNCLPVLPISASQIARIIGVSHCTQLVLNFWSNCHIIFHKLVLRTIIFH
jgi:hypothetical protein